MRDRTWLGTVCLLMALAEAVSAAEIRVCRALSVASSAEVASALQTTDRCSVLSGFREGETGKPAAVQTRAVVCRDRKSLHLHIECQEPEAGNVRAKCVTHDDPVFADDCIEVFLSPTSEGIPYYHFAANSRGTRYEEKVREKSWDAVWTAAGTVEKDRWLLDVTIPFSSLGAKPKRDALWRLNVDRQRQASGKNELSSWSPTGANFHDVRNFGYLVFDDDYATCLTRNILDPWRARTKRLTKRLMADAAVRAAFGKRIAEVEQGIAPIREAARSRAKLPVDEFASFLQQSRTALDSLAALEGDADSALRSTEVALAMRRLARPGRLFVAYAVRPITNAKVLPVPEVPRSVSDRLSITACRGEYEPASFVVYPFEELTELQVVATDLNGSGGVIGASALDLSVVKCWYQSGEGGMFPINQHKKVLTPELLLKDDTLVRVDFEKKENYLKLVFPSGETRWRWISNPKPTREEQDYSSAACPVRDAKALQPVTIPKHFAQQFWLTVHVPDDVKPGLYQGRVDLRAHGQTLGSLHVRLEVLPFDLEPNALESSIYFHWGINLDMKGEGSVVHDKRSTAQYKAELKNLLAHGVDNPTVSVPFDSGLLPVELRLRQEVGINNERLYYLIAGTGTSPDKIKQIIETAKQFGFREFYFYGSDEATGDALKAQRAQWEAVHTAGGKVFVAGSAGQNFPLVGDLQDLLVCYGRPSREEAAKWHSKGHKVFCYAHPQSGIEEPETYRRNFGLLLAANDYDGGMTYIYYHQWNDFDGNPYRGHNFVYPTVDGVIDTIQWEGYREGIDDLRYLATLRKAIAEAEVSSSPALRKAATEATGFVETMDVSGDLYVIRQEILRWILRLRRPGLPLK